MADQDPFIRQQQQRNAENFKDWKLYEPHRNLVSDLLISQQAHPGANLCVLGAGNCNDLDLCRLLASFAQVTLVDIDQEALDKGANAQYCLKEASLHRHGGLEVTGVWHELDQLSGAPQKSNSLIDQVLAKSAAWPGLPELGKFDVVASTCLLSQLVECCLKAVGEQHPRVLELVTAIRLRHIQLLCELTAPGGKIVLITDFVSSQTAPHLPRLDGEELGEALVEMLEKQNFFTGLNPFRLHQLLTEDPALTPLIDSVEAVEPWLWNFGARHYAVTALCCQRA